MDMYSRSQKKQHGNFVISLNIDDKYAHCSYINKIKHVHL